MADGNITLYVTTERAQEELARLLAENAALKREAHTWSKAAETYAASEAKLVDALRKLADAADGVGVRHFDTDWLSDEVQAMKDATLHARDVLGPNDQGNRPA